MTTDDSWEPKVWFHHGIFFCKCSYNLRHLPQNAGFKREKSKMLWYTIEPNRALLMEPYLTPELRELISKQLAERNAAVEESSRKDTSYRPPCPARKVFFPFQSAGIEIAIRRLKRP